MNWSIFPALRVLIYFIAIQLIHTTAGSSIALYFIGLCSVVCFWMNRKLYPTVLCLGIGIIFFVRLDYIPKLKLPPNHYQIEAITKYNSEKFQAYIQGSEKILLTIKDIKNYGDCKLYPSDIIKIEKQPKSIQYYTNNGFNYASYLNSIGIHKSITINTLPTLVYRNETCFQYLAEKFRRFIISNSIKHNTLTAETLGVFLAITVGEKSFLTNDIKNLFRDCGVSHVLAISGLHVGILFLSLQFIFKTILRLPKNIIFSFSLIALVCYAFLSGLSPSVLRATVMFIIILIGQTFLYKPNTLNTVFASALILLFINPNIISNVGFQLSYSAVIGIIIVNQYSFLKWPLSNKYLNWIWQLFKVNIGAFFFTAPVIIYHFHLLNVTSLLASFIVVPLISLLIYFCLVGLVVLNIRTLNTWVFNLLNYLVDFFIKLLNWFEESLILVLNVHINSYQCLALLGLFLTLFLKNKKPLILSCILLICNLMVL